MAPHELTGMVLRSSILYRPVMTTRIVICPEEEGQEAFPRNPVKNVEMSILGRHVLGGERIRVEYVTGPLGNKVNCYYLFYADGRVKHSDDLRERT